MAEHPTKALAQKPDSSISIGFELLKSGKVSAFCSAGNTGAMHVGAMFSVKPLEGVLRPALAGFVPKEDGSFGIILDIGANADCKPEVLDQFAEIGSLYAVHVLWNPESKGWTTQPWRRRTKRYGSYPSSSSIVEEQYKYQLYREYRRSGPF